MFHSQRIGRVLVPCWRRDGVIAPYQFRHSAIEHKKKTSLRVSVEAVRNAYVEHKERQARLRFLCKVSPHLKLLTFLQTTALQRKLSMRRVVARLCTG